MYQTHFPQKQIHDECKKYPFLHFNQSPLSNAKVFLLTVMQDVEQLISPYVLMQISS